MYTDGATRGNPGISGAGIYIKAHNENYEYILPLHRMSNHEAEFHAVIKALDICQQNYPNDILSFRSDSQVVVDIIDKGYSKNPTFRPLLEIAKNKIATFPYFFIKWIPQKTNLHADRLAKEAIHMQISEYH